MLACGHERAPFEPAMCAHLRDCREPWIRYVRWYVGSGFRTELLCETCAEERERHASIEVEFVCEECFEYATTEVGDLIGVRGQPEVRTRSEPFNPILHRTAIPGELGTVVDFAPIGRDSRSLWLMLVEGGAIIRFDADSGESTQLASTSVDPEGDHKPWCGHHLQRRLHASPGGEFAAVVNDYGRYGEIIDLRTGKATLKLDGGDYHNDTVPFSLAFTEIRGRVFSIHRTAWNRLDISDPSTGELLTGRDPTSYSRGEERPQHYLDYFHGALHLNPAGTQVVDDGWVWHPLGMPVAWSLEGWISGNVWESEDGPSKRYLCYRDYYWDHGMTWLDDNRVAIGGIGDDDNVMVDGVRVFDVSRPDAARKAGCQEILTFAGPAGSFFSNGRWLFSADQTGLSRWDIRDGARTGFLPDFRPARHHRSAGELVQHVEGVLVRCSLGD